MSVILYLMDTYYFSEEGLRKLKEEYENRTGQLRSDIAARIKEAKDQGDLSENQEYADAKEAQSMNEGRIEELKQMIEKAVIISASAKGGAVSIGSQIKVKSAVGEREFTIVGGTEADPATGLISNESPLGAAFLGHKKGDEVAVRTPKGEAKYKILEVR